MCPKPKQFQFTVEIECDGSYSKSDAENRLLKWLAAYGHTSLSLGFCFVGTRKIKKKRKKP